MKTIVTTLHPRLITFADKVAVQRNATAHERDYTPANGQLDENTGEDHQNGARCEAAGWRALIEEILRRSGTWRPVWHWQPVRDFSTKPPDIDDWIDVKGIKRRHHHLVIKQKELQPAWPYLLVSSHAFPIFELLGWCYGHEALTLGEVKELQPGRPAICVKPEALRPVDELLELGAARPGVRHWVRAQLPPAPPAQEQPAVDLSKLEALLGQYKAGENGRLIFSGGSLMVNLAAGTYEDFATGESGELQQLLTRVEAKAVVVAQSERAGSAERWQLRAALPDGLLEERELIGLLLLNEKRALIASEEIQVSDFMVGLHGAVFTYALQCATAEKPLVLAELSQALGIELNDQTIVAEGLPLAKYLAHLMTTAPAAAGDSGPHAVQALARAVHNQRLIDDGLAPAEPVPFKAKFGPVFWGEHTKTGITYDWLIKGLVPAGKRLLIAGPSRSGKTFQAFDMAAHIALGLDYNGHRTPRPAGVVYCFYESPDGAPKRMQAYCFDRNITSAGVPFVMLTKPPQLFDNVEHGKQLAAEIKELVKRWSVPLGVLVLDTHNASTLGSSEIRSEDISRVIGVHRGLVEATGASLWIIGHTNDDGKHRGNQQLYNGVDTSIFIERLEEKDGSFVRDDAGRIVRQATLDKQREGKDGQTWRFVLREVEVWKDGDGEGVTSMVVDAVADERSKDYGGQTAQQARTAGAIWLRTLSEIQFFRALLAGIAKKGMPASLTTKASANVQGIVRFADVVDAYAEQEPQKTRETDKHFEDRVNGRVSHIARTMRELGVVATDTILVDGTEPGKKVKRFVLWPTGRRVEGRGFQWPPQPRVVPADQLPPSEELPEAGSPF